MAEMNGIDYTEIKNEQQALDLLQAALSGSLDPDSIHLKFVEWPRFHVHLKGDGFDSTITSSNMQGFIELHRSVKRSYGLMKYGDSGRRLSRKELDDLELVVKVEKGSSEHKALLDQSVTTFVRELASMDSEHKLIATLGLALILGGVLSFKAFLNHRRDIRKSELEAQANAESRETRIAELEQMNFMAQQETVRVKHLQDAIAKVPALQHANDFVDDARSEILKGAAAANDIEIQGVKLKPGQVSELNTNARKKFKTDLISGYFKVTNLNSESQDNLKIRLKRKEDGLTLTLQVPDDGTEETDDLRSALVSAAVLKTLLSCTIEVTRSGEKVTSAEVKDFNIA